MSTISYFDLLNDDILCYILEILGTNCFLTYGSINKNCYDLFKQYNLPKKTSLGLLPLGRLEHYYQEKLQTYYNNDSAVWQIKRSISRSIVKYNRRDIIKWAIENSNNDILTQICNRAALVGNLEIIQEVYRTFEESTRATLRNRMFLCYAVKSGNVKLVKWLISEKFFAATMALHYAICEGDIKMLDCLHSNGLNYWNGTSLGISLYRSNLSDEKKNEIRHWIAVHENRR